MSGADDAVSLELGFVVKDEEVGVAGELDRDVGEGEGVVEDRDLPLVDGGTVAIDVNR